MPADAARLPHLLEVYKGLVEVSALINGITDSSELLPAIMEVARRVLKVEASSLFLVNASGDLELASADGGATGVNLAGKTLVVPRGRGISGWVLEHGQPLLIPDAYADPRFYREADKQTGFRTRSILCAPLSRKGKEIGVLQVLNPVGREAFDEADLEAFTAYGTLAATAIDKLRTLEAQRAQERVAQEMAIAREIQASFLPQSLPRFGNLEFASLYRPALNVGGDFFDVVELGPDEVYFVIGDVSGKGMPAALLMAQALSFLRLILQPGIPPRMALARWNEMLSGRTIRGMFITALLGRVSCAHRQVEICSAGHCHPFHVRPSGEAVEVPIHGSPPVGLLPVLHSASQVIELVPGEWLVLYTDGLSESFSPDQTLLERAGITRLLARDFAHAADVIDALNTGELHHRQTAPQHDDLTVLAFGFK